MENAFATNIAAARPDQTVALTRGVTRLFCDLDMTPICEFRLTNGRRADVAALDRRGLITFVEIKSCQADFDADQKWPEYLQFCDRFFFAVAPDFPVDRLPDEEGLIVADPYGGAIRRPAIDRPLAAARRKAVTLRFARTAALRAAAAIAG